MKKPLKIIVLATDTSANPSDKTTTEIRDLNRSEPDAALFEIPADYKMVCLKEGSQPDSPGSPSSGQQKR
jgi:hypothetical protein